MPESQRHSLIPSVGQIFRQEFEILYYLASNPGKVFDREKILKNPWQPRTHFDREKLDELAQSIKQHGILQPLVVTKEGDNYQEH